MTEIRPFPGALVDPAWASRVVSPMHDSLSPEARAQILATNPFSYLHVGRRPDEDEGAAEGTAAGNAALDMLIGAGAFQPSPAPALYIYRMRQDGHVQTGVVGEIPVRAFADGEILGHEAVQPERVDALARHFAEVPARSDLVALMHERDADVDALVTSVCEGPPALRMAGADGPEQWVWRIGDGDASALSELLGSLTLYVTDGHHRVAASIRRWVEAGRPSDAGVLSVLFCDRELRVLAFHRRVVGPVDPARTLQRLGEVASVEEAGRPARAPGAFGLYLGGRWCVVRLARDDALSGRAGLDVVRLHSEILEPVFGVSTTDRARLELVSELVPVEELAARCDADAGALFVLSPPTLAAVAEIADRGEVMPPKATYFHPKPRSGVFLRFEGVSPL